MTEHNATYLVRHVLFGLVFSLIPGIAVSSEDPFADISQMSVDEISRRLDNPLTSLWSLVLQSNMQQLDGDALNGPRWANTTFFQPLLPVPVGKDYSRILAVRPVIPYVSTPVLSPDGDGSTDGNESGLGDIQMAAFYGPNKVEGTVWGVGATFKFPTASEDSLGQDKWQVGPALMLINTSPRWTLGVLAQHWNSVAGNDDRADTSQTDIQYIIRRNLGNGWSLGMGPTISIDWKADSDDAVTFPVGLGITKTVRWGITPWKLRLEPQYSLIKPDTLGTEWTIRFQIAPVINSPFSKGFGSDS